MSDNNDKAHDRLSMLASVLACRDIKVIAEDGESPTWTDGAIIYVSNTRNQYQQLCEICVQAALIGAGSLNKELIQKLSRRPKIAHRYLSLEGQRVLNELEYFLPPAVSKLVDVEHTPRTCSAQQSLAIAMGSEPLPAPNGLFGVLRPKKILANIIEEGSSAESSGRHQPREQKNNSELEEHENDAVEDGEDSDDFSQSPVGGGGGIGKMLQKLFQQVRRISGEGSPGADAASHWSRSGPRAGVRALQSTAQAETVDDAFGKGIGILYPEWHERKQCYQFDWCTVQEVEPPHDQRAAVDWLEGYGLRKPLTRLSMGLGRYHRQAQGDEIDIDAAIEAQVEILAGSTPDESVYIESQRHRRDLSVMILLDISGSVSQPSSNGKTVHELQRAVAAELTTVLYEIGDRVSLYAFHSQGRNAVHMVPIKRFEEHLDGAVMNRLHSLKPGAYSRLGAAIRHGATTMIDKAGTPRKLLVVLSDGLAYDHGYEPVYGAADARKALAEARRDGVGCLCLSIGANTDAEVLSKVFGSAAHATIPDTNKLSQMIGPLFRSALRAAEVQRRVA